MADLGDQGAGERGRGGVLTVGGGQVARSRGVDGGFLASRTAMERFNSVPPFAIRDLGRLPIRGRADGIDVVGLEAPALA